MLLAVRWVWEVSVHLYIPELVGSLEEFGVGAGFFAIDFVQLVDHGRYRSSPVPDGAHQHLRCCRY